MANSLRRRSVCARRSLSKIKMNSNDVGQKSSKRTESLLSPEQGAMILKQFADDLNRKDDEISAEPTSKKSEKQAGSKTKKKASSVAPDASSIGTAELLEFSRNGHLFLPDMLSIAGVSATDLYDTLEDAFYDKRLEAFVQKLRVFGVDEKTIKKINDPDEAYGLLQDLCEDEGFEIPFWQLFNPHRDDRPYASLLNKICLNKGIGKLAADLLGVDSVMLYQTCAFIKEPGHGETAWHSDLNTSPFDTNDMLTFWISVTPVKDLDDSPLEFASGSHRDFALPYWYSNEGMMNLEDRDYPVASHAPLAPGDATAHHGWVLHAAPPNLSEDTRIAFTIAYVKTGAKRIPKKGLRRNPDDEDLEGYSAWIKDVAPGRPIKHAMLPVVFSRKE
uniref:Uncharacterized protein n=1 Tax=Guillardia theta TaxID=55529 RepID=A0A7S4UHM6_GUITH